MAGCLALNQTIEVRVLVPKLGLVGLSECESVRQAILISRRNHGNTTAHT